MPLDNRSAAPPRKMGLRPGRAGGMSGGMVQAATATESPGAARVRVQEILLTAAATALLILLAWLASSMVQVGKDIEQLRGEVALVRSAVERNAERLQRIESLLLAGRSGGESAPRKPTAQRQ